MRSNAVPIAIVVGGAIIAAALYASLPKVPGNNPTLIRPIGAADHIFGNPAARVFIVEYADFTCEYCKGFHDTLHQIVANVGAKGQVAWVFRHFPLDTQSASPALAKAAECASIVGGPDAFWRFANALYASQPVAPSDLGTIAASIGITGDAFASCYSTASTTLDARIATDRENALQMGAVGAPFSVIIASGKTPVVLESAYSFDAVKQIIDQILGQ